MSYSAFFGAGGVRPAMAHAGRFLPVKKVILLFVLLVGLLVGSNVVGLWSFTASVGFVSLSCRGLQRKCAVVVVVRN